MSSQATVLYVMIASPGDVAEAREATYRALSRWNESNTRNRGVVLVPLRWETSAVPELGAPPQEIINEQLLADADIVIALFGSRIGTRTSAALSGTAEEIGHAVDAGKPVHVYFSTAPHPNDVDVDQLQALRDFQTAIRERGLYGSFANSDELVAHIWQAIEKDVVALGARAPEQAIIPNGARLIPHLTGSGAKVKVSLTNDGDVDAEQLSVTSVADRLHLFGPTGDRTLVAGQTQSYPAMLAGGDQEPRIHVEWSENGEPRARDFDL